MPTRPSVTAEVEAIVGGATREKGVEPVTVYLDLALRDVNQYAPREVRSVLVGDGTDEYDLPATWSRGFSVIRRVRHVADNDFDAPAVYLPQENYAVEQARRLVSSEAVGSGDGTTKAFALDQNFADPKAATVTVNAVTQAATAYTITGGPGGSLLTFVTAPPSGEVIVASYYVDPPQIRLAVSPSASDVVVVEHTARHTLADSEASTTLSDDQAGALAHRAAALLLRAAAAGAIGLISQATDTDILAEIGGNRGDAYRRLADDEDKTFDAMMGIDRSNPAATGGAGKPVLVSVPATPNRANSRYLTHPRRSAAYGGGL